MTSPLSPKEFLELFPNSVIRYIDDQKRGLPVKTPTVFGATKIPQGYGAFFTVNGFHGNDKHEKNLKNINGVQVDVDRVTTKEELLMAMSDDLLPTIINQTKNGFHCIWLLDAPLTEITDELVATVKGINRTICERYGGDKAATDVARLLRIPGTLHQKEADNLVEIKTVYHVPDNRYSLSELLEVYPAALKSAPVAAPGTFADDTEKVLQKMLRKDKIKQLYDGELGQKSEQDQALCNHLAFWFGKDMEVMRSVWLQSPLGQREKVQKRKDYQDMTLGKAIANTTETYDPHHGLIIADEIGEEINLDTLMSITKNRGKDTEYEQILDNDENIIRILSYYQIAKYDSFKNRSYVKVGTEWLRRDDGADGKVYSWIVSKFPFLAAVPQRKVAQMITVVQYRYTFDSAQDYLNSITWDGTPRLSQWLHSVFYVENDKYHQEIGRKWWMGLASRMLNPGCKFDNVLIIQGGQRVGKSTVFLIIAGEENHIEFTETHVKEMTQDMQGKLVVEFAEAAIFSKADTETLKSIVTRQTDTFRVPYEEHPRDFKRRCVFAVTANNDDILKDATGGRRWWVVDLPSDMKVYPPKRMANFAWLKENRDQLFAEAAARVQVGEEFWELDDYELKKRQRAITATEQDEDLFYNWYHALSADEQNRGVSIRDAYCGAYKVDFRGDKLDITTTSIKKTDEMRVGRILTKIGLVKKRERSAFGRLILWVPGEDLDRDYTIKFPVTKHEKIAEEDW